MAETRTTLFDPTSVRLATTDIAAYNLNTKQQVYVPQGTTALPEGYDWSLPSEAIDSSTTGIRQEENAVKNDASELLNQLGTAEYDYLNQYLNSTSAATSSEGQTKTNELEQLAASLGVETPEMIQQASAAGQAAYDRYASLINEAQEQKRKGMAKATIGGGERGGFMSTQIAGGAALQPIEGENFVGAGGELEEIQRVYDLNISNLKVAAEQARREAENAAEEAYHTGKQEAYDRAVDSYDKWEKATNEANNLALEKVQAINNYQLSQQAQVKFDQSQEDRLKEQASEQLNYYMDMGIDYIKSNKDEIAKLFEESGFESADVDSIITKMENDLLAEQEKALKDGMPKPELRTVDGSLYFVTYSMDKNGNITPKTEMLIAKKASGGGGGSSGGADTENEKQAIQSDIKAIMGNDRYLDTAKYREIRENVAINAPSLLSWFDKTYDPQNWLNPQDPTAKSYFLTGTKLAEEDEL